MERDPDYKRKFNERAAARMRSKPWQRAATQKKRIAAQLQRTPYWANLHRIKETYRRAYEKTQETGIEYNVDHIVPLQGELVSGLHVENNLQIIPAIENFRKSNKYAIVS
jgi:hypothetical protein